jgi:hypothetical protein
MCLDRDFLRYGVVLYVSRYKTKIAACTSAFTLNTEAYGFCETFITTKQFTVS